MTNPFRFHTIHGSVNVVVDSYSAAGSSRSTFTFASVKDARQAANEADAAGYHVVEICHANTGRTYRRSAR